MKKNKKILLICSEDPRVINNGVTAALNTCLRSTIEFSDRIDIYIHNERKFIDISKKEVSEFDFTNIDIANYDLIFLSPINIAFRYLFFYKKIKKSPVISFLSDTYSYTLYRNFILGLKFDKLFIKYIFKVPIIYLMEKYVEQNSKMVVLQTKRDVAIFNKLYFSKKSIAFPNSPILKDIEITNIGSRNRIGWIVSCTDDYFPLTKWFFTNIVVKVLTENIDMKLHIHGKDSNKLKEYIDIKYPKNKFNIVYTAFVDDISVFYLDTKIILSPIYKGYGLINRSIEAMYHGCIVIGDPGAFNGIENAKDGVNCFIANNNEEFIKKIENLYKSSNLEEISTNAHNTIKSDFDIKNNIEILSDSLN